MDTTSLGFGPIIGLSCLGALEHQERGIFAIIDTCVPDINGLFGCQVVYFGAGIIALELSKLQECPCLNSGGRRFFDLSFSYARVADAEPNLLTWLKANFPPVCASPEQVA